LNYAKNPGRLREEILAHLRQYNDPLFVVDEIQKIPALLDEVHELIESRGIRFILTGSSSRKLGRGGANLLAGRADIRLFWWAVGIHSNTPLTSLLHGRSNSKILLLIQEDIAKKIIF